MVSKTPAAVHHLTGREARAARITIESMAPPVGQPIDYDDCLLLGLWQRLGRGQRNISESSWQVLQARRASETLRELSPTRLLDPSDVIDLAGNVLLWRVFALTSEGDRHLDQTDDLLAMDGMLAALKVPRIYFSGRRLLALLQDAETA